VLEGGLAGIGGANSNGAITLPAGPLVEGAKYRSSICGDILGSKPNGAESEPEGLFVAPDTTAVFVAAAATEAARLVETFVTRFRLVETAGAGGSAGGTTGGGSGILIKFVPEGGFARKRNGAGPTAGK